MDCTYYYYYLQIEHVRGTYVRPQIPHTVHPVGTHNYRANPNTKWSLPPWRGPSYWYCNNTLNTPIQSESESKTVFRHFVTHKNVMSEGVSVVNLKKQEHTGLYSMDLKSKFIDTWLHEHTCTRDVPSGGVGKKSLYGDEPLLVGTALQRKQCSSSQS